ncbi:MAG: DUF2442 domain-containing protein [Candidatus Delongbacteria bacterium]|nr:DUF2442 domain-containing protein [Candidatus Delongbacteria bacterium]
MEKIIQAIPLDDYRIQILTSSGISGIFDVKPYLKGRFFSELLDESYFKSVKPMHYGIAWPHEQDFSSDTIIWDIQNSVLEASLKREMGTRVAEDKADYNSK